MIWPCLVTQMADQRERGAGSEVAFHIWTAPSRAEPRLDRNRITFMAKRLARVASERCQGCRSSILSSCETHWAKVSCWPMFAWPKSALHLQSLECAARQRPSRELFGLINWPSKHSHPSGRPPTRSRHGLACAGGRLRERFRLSR